MRIIYRPVAADSHFLFDQPICGSLQRRMFRGETGLSQRNNIDRGIPNWRETRLDPEIGWVIYEQPGKIMGGFGVNWVRLGITERAQRDQGVEHCRKNCCEAITPLADSLDHPALRLFEGALPHRVKTKRMKKLEDIIDAQEKITPGEKALVAWQSKILMLGAERIEFMQLFVAW